MGFIIRSKDFVEYTKLCADRIAAQQEVILRLNSNNGKDYGWGELGAAFSAVAADVAALAELPVYVILRNMGLLLLGRVGSDCAMLFGSSYISASKCIEGKDALTCRDLYLVLDAMCRDMMARGKTKPGDKSIIDALHPAVTKFMICLEIEADEAQLLQRVKKAALDGARSTKEMTAKALTVDQSQGDATGAEDVGAYLMALRIACLCDYISEKLI